MSRAKLYTCRSCGGEGVLNDYAFSIEVELCETCGGSGEVLATPIEARILLGEPEGDKGGPAGDRAHGSRVRGSTRGTGR